MYIPDSETTIYRDIIKLYFSGCSLKEISSKVGLRFDQVVDCIDAYLLQPARSNQNYRGEKS